MMAETAGFVRHAEGLRSGERLFLLASINVYVATLLLVFALTRLPAQSDKEGLGEILWVSRAVMLFIILGAIIWMWRSVVSRMPSTHGKIPVISALIAGSVVFALLHCLVLKNRISPICLLHLSFLPILCFTGVSLGVFAGTFKDGDKVHSYDVWLFCLSVTYTCASLAVIAFDEG
jgi:hypothetical protein